MLLTFVHENEQDRLYATRHQSVVSYFTADETDDGVILHVEPGYFSIPVIFQRVAADVRASILEIVAARVGVAPDEVLKLQMAKLCKFADPDLPEHYRFAKRPRGRNKPLNRAY